MSKPFDQELYDKYDNAKLVMLAWCNKNLGHSFINPDTYGPDLVTQAGFVEVEVVEGWSGNRWPYPTVHIATRKRSWIGTHEPLWFCVMNRERTRAMMISSQWALEAPIITVSNKYSNAESFMNIKPTSVYINLTGLSDTLANTLEEDLGPSQATGP